MTSKPRIYDSVASASISLDSLTTRYRQLDVHRVVYKLLSPNDNSKNQPYLAGHFTDLGYIPTKEVVSSPSNSRKSSDPKRQVKFTANLSFNWLSPEGTAYPAPTAKLIYYPQFPEVRLSGFLKGCAIDMGGWMDPARLGRSPGRVLLLGLRRDGEIFAYMATPHSRIAKEVQDADSIELSSVLRELSNSRVPQGVDNVGYAVGEKIASYHTQDMFSGLGSSADQSRHMLLTELRRIHLAGFIESKKFNSEGTAAPYKARNGGGYTMEAELGVIPNGLAEPDFHGWEVKQFGVQNFEAIESKALTVMTPEPDGGLYKREGVKPFMHLYGYENANIHDRRDFTGRHFSNQICKKSGLTLVTPGFDSDAVMVTDANGYIGLLDSKDNVAASWSFAKLLEHWKKKHAKAVYIPSVASDTPEGIRAYHFGKDVRLYEGTNLDLLLGAVAQRQVYYDPGIKMEKVSTGGKVKKRSQFRVKSQDLGTLYNSLENVDVTEPF